MTRATEFEDARWRHLVELSAMGELSSPHDEAFLEEHVPSDAEALAERELLDALGQLGTGDAGSLDPTDLDADAIVRNVLAEFGGDAPWAVPQPAPTEDSISIPLPRDGRRWRRGAVAVALMFLALGTFARGRLATPPANHLRPIAAFAAAPSGSAARDAEASSESLAHAVMSGAFATVGQPREDAPSKLTAGARVRVQSSRACLQSSAALACFTEGSTLHVGDSDLEIVGGRGDIELHTYEFAIMVAGTRYRSRGGAHLSVVVGPSQTWRVDTQGPVEVFHADGRREHANGSRSFSSGPAATPERGLPSPQRLLAQAREQRARGDLEAAAHAYEQLLTQHGKHPLASSSLVAAAQLHVELGHPRKALRYFDRYLAKGGPLSEEASFGRIAALQSLGQQSLATAAIADFQRRFPASSYRARLRPRSD